MCVSIQQTAMVMYPFFNSPIQFSGCSIEELCFELKDAIMDEVLAPYGSLLRAVEFAVELGMDLGLLSLTNKRIRIPFKLFPKNKLPEYPRKPKKSSRKTVRRVSSCDIFMHFVIPNILQKKVPRVAGGKRKITARFKPKLCIPKKAASCCPTHKKNNKATLAVGSFSSLLIRQIKKHLVNARTPANP